MTEPLPTYQAAAPAPTINETAVTIAAEISGVRPETGRRWLESGAVPPPFTYRWGFWICYQTAVKAWEMLRPSPDDIEWAASVADD